MHVQISILHQGNVHWQLSAWLSWLALNERRRPFSITYWDGRVYGGRPVTSNRNMIVRDRPPGADVLMIDADTVPSNRLFDLTLAGLDVVQVPVPIYRPDNPEGPVILNIVPVAGADKALINGITYQEIAEGGSGVLFMSNKVLDAVGPAPFRFQFDADGVMERGEDHEFCRKARENGFQVWSALDLLCGHDVRVNLKTVADAMPSMDAASRRFKVVVTGTGRSGTGFAAKWLTSAGLPCGHEAFFTITGWEGAVKQMRRHPELVGESSWMAGSWLLAEQFSQALVIHQVRHPRKVAESCMRHPPGTTPQYLEYLEHQCPEVGFYDDDLNKAVARWVYWNQRIERDLGYHDQRLHYFWRIEDGEGGLLEWLLEKGAVQNVDPQQLYSNREYNPHRHDVEASARWDDIDESLKGPLAEMMERYGYGEW